MIFGGLRGGGSLLQKTDEIGERRLWCGQSRKEGARERWAATGAVFF
jgi:hypothetical protein